MARFTKFNDQELVVLLHERDQAAFTTIYNRYWPTLYVYARKILSSKDDAEDVVQEVLSDLWTKPPDVGLTNSLSAYLFSCVRYKALNLIDRQKVRADYIDSLQDFIDKGEYTTDQYVRERELHALISQSIALLPPKMREIFELSRNKHLSHKEIAEKLNIADTTVKKQIYKAIRILRSKLTILTGYLLYFLLQ